MEGRFFRPRRQITLVDFGSTLEALCLRTLLEAMGAGVTMHFVGAPQDLFAVLDQKEMPAEFLVLCGHGTENGLFLGEYGEEIDTSRLINGHLPAAALEGNVALRNTTVLSTACLSGSEAYARAFLGGGARLYAAPRGFPEAADVLLFAHQFFHAALVRGDAPLSAASGASRGCVEPKMFQVFSNDAETTSLAREVAA